MAGRGLPDVTDKWPHLGEDSKQKIAKKTKILFYPSLINLSFPLLPSVFCSAELEKPSFPFVRGTDVANVTFLTSYLHLFRGEGGDPPSPRLRRGEKRNRLPWGKRINDFFEAGIAPQRVKKWEQLQPTVAERSWNVSSHG